MVDFIKIEETKRKIFNGANSWQEKLISSISMLSEARMDNILYCLKECIENGIPGDFVETGVWRGGACIFARTILKEYAENDRTVWVCDSFEGMPENEHPVDIQYNLDWNKVHPYIAVSLKEVQKNFEQFGVLDTGVKFVQGFFSETMPTLPVEKIAVLRLDGDMYASTLDVLNNLYQKVSKNGFIIVDDYDMGLDTAKDAIHDFRTRHCITSPLISISGDGVYWRKTE